MVILKIIAVTLGYTLIFVIAAQELTALWEGLFNDSD